MNVDDLRTHFKCGSDLKLSQVLGMTAGNISHWRTNGIPIARQAMLQIQTKGKLKAEKPVAQAS
jgi:hypothetical protein